MAAEPDYVPLTQQASTRVTDAGEIEDGVWVTFRIPAASSTGRVFVPGNPPDAQLAHRLMAEYALNAQAIAAPPQVTEG